MRPSGRNWANCHIKTWNLNDVERDLLEVMFTPEHPKVGMRTWKISLTAWAVFAVDLAMAPEWERPDDEATAGRRSISRGSMSRPPRLQGRSVTPPKRFTRSASGPPP